MTTIPESVRSLVPGSPSNGHHSLERRDLLEVEAAMPPATCGFFSREGRIERQRRIKTRQQVVDGQLAALKDKITTDLAVHREVCKSTLEQVRIALRETVQIAAGESAAARTRHSSDLIVAIAENLDGQLARLERIRHPTVRAHVEKALLSKLDRIVELLE